MGEDGGKPESEFAEKRTLGGPAEVDRVGFVFAQCETDGQLEGAVARFLLPLLHTVACHDDHTRSKVMEVLVHVSKRLKSTPQIRLPIEDILHAFSQPDASSFFMNFAILYVKMGYSRLETARKIELFPLLFRCIEKKPVGHQMSLLTLVVAALGEVEDASELASGLRLLETNATSAETILQFFCDVLLLPYVRSAEVPPGFSESSYKSLQQYLDSSFKEEFLEKVKLGLVNFVSSLDVPENRRFSVIVIASAETHFSVAAAADTHLKKNTDAVDLGDTVLVRKLCTLFCGDKKPNSKPEDKRSAAPARLKLKILPQLTKSQAAANLGIEVIQVVFEACFGASHSNKTRQAALLFLHHVTQAAKQPVINQIAPVLKAGCVKLLNDTEQPLERRSLGLTAMAIAKLALRKPDLMRNDWALLSALFAKVRSEDRDVRLAMQESLSLLADVYTDLPPDDFRHLETVLDSVCDLYADLTLQLITLKFVQRAFPSHHIPSRFLLLMLCSPNEPCPALASKGSKCPEFKPMLDHIKSDKRFNLSGLEVARVERMCLYLRHCLVSSADPEADFAPQELRVQSKSLHSAFSKNEDLIMPYYEMVAGYLKIHSSLKLAFLVKEIFMIGRREIIIEQSIKEVSVFKRLTLCYQQDFRISSCELYSLVLLGKSDKIPLGELISELKSEKLESFSAACFTLAFLVKHASTRNIQLETTKSMHLIMGQVVNSQSERSETALLALSECAAFTDLSIIPQDEFDDVLDSCKKSLSATDARNSRKEAVCAFLGNLCIGCCPKHELKKKCIDILLESSKVKQHDIQFFVGGALLKCAIGDKYPLWRDWLSPPTWPDKDCGTESSLLGLLLDRILKEYCTSLIPHLPQTCAIWLSEVLGPLPGHPDVASRSSSIQTALMRLLSSRDEMTQELASTALGALFNTSDETQKKVLIDHMMQVFSEGGSKHKIQSGEEQLFSEGELGQMPTGGSITTYKDLCSLATDMNKPDLVYKFINLANHNLMWNSRKGAAFGFSYLAKEAGEELEQYYPSLLPKLYRFKNDPNPQVKDAMQRIWNSVVTDPKKMIEKFSVEISCELLSSLQNREWRVREAACLATSEFSSHLYEKKTLHQVPEFWLAVFRVCDDIKESVRAAAERSLATLSRSAVKCCGPDSGPLARAAILDTLLPVLVQTGIISNVKSVSSTSLQCVMEISKESQAALKPHVPLLMQALLQSVSEMEPSEMNYLSVRAGEGSAAQSMLDSMRASSAKSSGPMDCLSRLTLQIDQSNVELVVDSLASSIQSAVALTGKTGAAHVVSLLCINCPSALLQPHAVKLVKRMTNKLSDPNVVVRSAFSSSIANVLKVSKSSVVEKYLVKLKNWCLEKPEAGWQETCARAMADACRLAPDAMSHHSALVAPLAYVGMFATDPAAKKGTSSDSQADHWESVWSSCVQGTESGLKLYLDEVMDLCSVLLGSQSWERKAQSARVVASLVRHVTRRDTSHLDRFLSLLCSAGGGGLQSQRYWTGKEAVMQAVGEVCQAAGQEIQAAPDGELQFPPHKIAELVTAQFSANPASLRAYDVSGAVCVGRVYRHLSQDALYPHLLQILQSKLKKSYAVRERRSDDDSGPEIPVGKLQTELVRCVSTAFPDQLTDQKEVAAPAVETLLEAMVQAGDKGIVRVVLESVSTIFDRLERVGGSWLVLVESTVNSLSSLDLFTTDTIRIAYFKCLFSIATLPNECTEKLPEVAKAQLMATSEYHKTNFGSNPQLLDHVQKLISIL